MQNCKLLINLFESRRKNIICFMIFFTWLPIWLCTVIVRVINFINVSRAEEIHRACFGDFGDQIFWGYFFECLRTIRGEVLFLLFYINNERGIGRALRGMISKLSSFDDIYIGLNSSNDLHGDSVFHIWSILTLINVSYFLENI